MTYASQVAGNVRAEIGRAGKQKKDLQEILGLSYKAVNERWNEEQEFSLSQLYQIAKALKIPISRLTQEEKYLYTDSMAA